MFRTNATSGNYWITGPDETGNCPGDTIFVDSLQVVTINGFTMNRIVPVPPDYWPPFPLELPTIVYNAPLYERFGSIGFFFPLAICITDAAGGPLCYYSDSAGFIFSNLASPFCINVPTSLTTLNNENMPTLSPTISSGQMNVNLSFVRPAKEVMIELLDINGRILNRYDVKSTQIDLDVSYHNEGIHISRITLDKQRFNLKFIKNNPD
jgi:hypothetical protein